MPTCEVMCNSVIMSENDINYIFKLFAFCNLDSSCYLIYHGE